MLSVAYAQVTCLQFLIGGTEYKYFGPSRSDSDKWARFRSSGRKRGARNGGSGTCREPRTQLMFRLGTALQSHSSGLLIHRSGYSHVRSGLKVEIEFEEVKIRVWIYWHPVNSAWQAIFHEKETPNSHQE